MAAIYDEHLFNSLYATTAKDENDPDYGQYIWGYHRRTINALGGVGRRYGPRANKLIELGLDASDSVMVVGAGFGYLIEALHAEGATNVWAIDDSPYIHEDPELFLDQVAPAVRGSLKNVRAGRGLDVAASNRPDMVTKLLESVLPQSYDWVVTDDCISSMEDDELDDFLDDCEAMLAPNIRDMSRVVHFITPLNNYPGDSALNWKPAIDWMNVRPSHTWVNLVGMQVVV